MIYTTPLFLSECDRLPLYLFDLNALKIYKKSRVLEYFFGKTEVAGRDGGEFVKETERRRGWTFNMCLMVRTIFHTRYGRRAC